VADVLPGSESWCESRMREIRTSGLTRGEGCHAALRDRSLSYSTATRCAEHVRQLGGESPPPNPASRDEGLAKRKGEQPTRL
jgi:hypothetical protein